MQAKSWKAPLSMIYMLYHYIPIPVGLLGSLPNAAQGSESRLSTIEGVAPSLIERSHACVFANRCPVAIDKCFTDKPPLEETKHGRLIRCWRWQEIDAGEITATNKPAGLSSNAMPQEGYVLEAKSMDKRFGEESLFDRLTGKEPEYVHAVDDVSINIRERSTLGLVGESGSGKTTLARCIVALHEANGGQLELCEVPISKQLNQRSKDALRNLQMVFQNPHDALNPYQTVGQSIGRTISVLSERKQTDEKIKVARE